MYSKKKVLLLTMLLFVIMTAFAGCGNNNAANDEQATPTAAPTQAPTQAPTVAPTEVPIDYETATPKDVWADYFYMGAVLNGQNINMQNYKDLVINNFNSFTMENEMKPDAILDYQRSVSDLAKYNESPAINFARSENAMKFAKENGLKMRGHTLVWHAQTPRWFFTENYSNAPNAPYVSRELMLKRMENYIKQVLEYTQTNYPDIIYAWDVVNEAVNPGDGDPKGLRTESLWYTVVGDDFVEKAFEYARKYAAPGVGLFYNDYNTEDPMKVKYTCKLLKPIVEAGNIDGIGMQSHIGFTSPSLSTIDASVREYAELGLEIQVTELDMGLTTNTEEDFLKQATRYKRLFLYYKKWKDEGINLTSVTFWGTTDDRSWLNKPGVPSYPLLFNGVTLEKKPAFFGILLDPDIPLY